MANTIVVDIVADTRKLVKGVGETNQKLSTLNGTASKISNGFGLVTKALAGLAAARFVWTWVTDFEKEQLAFASLAKLFGDDADKVIEKVNLISEKFVVDDGDVAQTLVTLGNSTLIRYRGILDEIAELTFLANNLDPTKDISSLTSAWVKALRSGQALGGDEISKFGLGSTLTQSELENFKKLKTITEQVKFLYGAAQDDINERLQFSTAQKLQKQFEDLKDVIAELLIPVLNLVVPILEKLVNLITYEDEDGQTKLHEEVKLLAGALATVWTVGKLAGLVAALEASDKALGKISKELKSFPGLLKGLTFPEILTAFGLLIESIWSKLGKFAKGLVIYFLVEIGEWAAREIVKKFPKDWQEVGNAIIDGVVAPFKDPVTWFINTIKTWWKGIKEAFLNWGKFYFGIASPSKVAKDLGADIVAGLAAAFSITNLITVIKTFFTNILARFKTEVAQTNWGQVGRDIISALVTGMKAVASSPISFITKLAKDMISTFKAFFKISSPSKVFMGYGENLMQGLALGIRGSSGLAAGALSGLSLTPSFGNSRGSQITVNINAGIGTDPYEVGRYVKAALDKYAGVNGR